MRPDTVADRSERGSGFLVILMIMAVCVLLIGMGIDLGYLYLVHTELDAIAQSRALGAAHELDGTWDGIYRARNAAGHAVGDAPAGSISIATAVAFAKDPASDYTPSPLTADGYRYARASVTATTRLFFMHLLPDVKAEWSLTATAQAGLVEMEGAGTGIVALSPRAPDLDSETLGFVAGETYALNDARNVDYLDVGQRADGDGLRDVIINGSNYLSEPIRVNSTLRIAKTRGDLAAALRARLLQDSNTVSMQYADYVRTGNGRRILVTPVNDGRGRPRVAGFGVFLLQPGSCTGADAPCSATYLGSTPVLNAIAPADKTPGIYQIAILR